MTNLIERLLLIGLGIFLLTFFISFAFPLINELDSYETSVGNELRECDDFISQIDAAIFLVIESPEDSVYEFITFPDNLNLSIYQTYITFEYYIEKVLIKNPKQYGVNFISRKFHDMYFSTYYLSVNWINVSISINFL